MRALPLILLAACGGPKLKEPAAPVRAAPTFRWEIKHILVLPDGSRQVGIYVYRRVADTEMMASLVHVVGDTIGVVQTEKGPQSMHHPRDPKTARRVGDERLDFNTGAVLKTVEAIRKTLPGPLCPHCPAGANRRDIPYAGNHVVVEAPGGAIQEWWRPALPAIKEGPCPAHR